MLTKVLYDTDIGSDIDDAISLAYLLAQPQCELLGVTTVSGQADKRAMLASVLCKAAGKQIPIFPGADNPLLVPALQPEAPQAAALKNWAHDTDFPRGQAIEFLRATIHAHPGEITLLATGPMTNIALLFAVDPAVPKLLKGLVMMCGVFEQRLAEWNARCDPQAAMIVYRAPVARHRSIGLDVTLQVTMQKSEVEQRFTGSLLTPVRDFAAHWFSNTSIITFHDPLAAATIFDDQICGFVPANVEPNESGETPFKPANAGAARHEIAQKVDPARFFKHFFETFAPTL